jgi:hypothetical protein
LTAEDGSQDDLSPAGRGGRDCRTGKLIEKPTTTPLPA